MNHVPAKKCFFRVDANPSIGMGHLARCLTLADELSSRGVSCCFVSNGLGHELIDLVDKRGHQALLMDLSDSSDELADAHAFLNAVHISPLDIAIVDHYHLNERWEKRVAETAKKLVAIDDLANRPHQCDILMDQTLGRAQADYLEWVNGDCELLTGALYTLLRPEFLALKPQAVERRSRTSRPGNVLLSFGGSEQADRLIRTLAGVSAYLLEKGMALTIVLSQSDLKNEALQAAISELLIEVDVLGPVDNMHHLILDHDIAIGAAGSMSWERCCLGLPSIAVVIADNQRLIAANLEQAGACRLVGEGESYDSALRQALEDLSNPEIYHDMAERAFNVCDGLGARRVADAILNE